MGISTIKQPIDWSKLNIFSEFPELVKNYGMDAADYILSVGASDLYTKMNVGFDVTEEDILRHRMNKSMNYDGGLKGYKHINTNSIPVSDATDGSHIRSGIDFANLATGNLPGGGIPAALSGIGYQQLAGLFDGTVGKYAFLQSVDNIRGLRESGKAPALDALYNFGGTLHDIWNKPYEPLYDYSGKIDNKNIFNQGTIDVNKRDAFTGKQLADSLAMDAQLAYNQVPNYPTGPGTTVIPTVSADLAPHTSSTQGPAGATTLEIANNIIRRDGVPSRTSDAALAHIQANIAAAKEKAKSTVLPKPVKSTPLSGPAGGPPVRNRTQSTAPVFKRYGPPNRQRY